MTEQTNADREIQRTTAHSLRDIAESPLVQRPAWSITWGVFWGLVLFTALMAVVAKIAGGEFYIR